MKFSTGLTLAAYGASAVVAAPTPAQKRAAGVTDADILNYALTLEHLEDKFYREALANYTEADFASHGFDSTFYKNLMTVSSDEMTHVSFLTSGLMAAGATPVAECTYSFPATDPTSFVKLASVLEGVGISAYLGAAADIMSKVYLTDAGSILTVEARHSAYIRQSLGQSSFPSPFDTPLDFDEVYSLASQYIVECPASNPALPVKAFPLLELSPTQAMPINQGDTINLMSKATTVAPYAAFAAVTGPMFVPATSMGNGMYQVKVPSGATLHGQNYVVLNSGNTEVTDETVVSGPAIVEIAGTM
ncbi:MAG: hypothetical protein M1828_000355 [Chrysothrix sp. TS-e1954]|nr:MAG: hypothetical protein M1828_000355 [Chrysothrix sp. TS-e1954]